ncbi:unnamed protein product [Cuscuta epithymum]|uniref:J domain-containing protein n=1 Tax=Cuscuta epithymum TaxID=186058 RepID=A0AAV0G204_9ASTE|nr:unnamed protein product [Cuscuta epithymum]
MGRATWALTVTLVIFFLIQPSISIYCDEDDCYDLLGISQNANSSEIKKAYYKLSLKFHPDKNPDPESRAKFVKIANAYEILKDEATREQYDYAIAHPEEIFYNTARYYQAYYGHKTDPRAVLVGLLLLLSLFQYLNQWTRLLTWSRKHQLTKISCVLWNLNAVEVLQVKRRATNRWISEFLTRGRKMEEELSKELNLQIKGAEIPSIWELVGVRFLLLPYTIGKLVLWHGCWLWRYTVKGAPYSREDASYLTRRSLGVPIDSWRYIEESAKEDLIQRRLWEKSNLESYLAESRKESKRRR